MYFFQATVALKEVPMQPCMLKFLACFLLIPMLMASRASAAELTKQLTGEGVYIKIDGQWRKAKLPLKQLAAGKSVKVRVQGKLIDGIFVIGGETTGTLIQFGKISWELELGNNQKWRVLAAKLNGKQVMVTGKVRTKAAIEVRQRTIVTVETFSQADIK